MQREGTVGGNGEVPGATEVGSAYKLLVEKVTAQVAESDAGSVGPVLRYVVAGPPDDHIDLIRALLAICECLQNVRRSIDRLVEVRGPASTQAK